MKRTILIWLLTAMLLCSCTAKPNTTHPTNSTATAIPTAPPEGFYRADTSMEIQTQGAVRTYPLEDLECTGIAAMAEGVLLFSPTENGTMLTKLAGEELYPTATREVSASLTALLVNEEGVSFFDGEAMVLLDEDLREITTVVPPADLTGTPLLAQDRKTLYYCTGSNLCVLDRETGIARILRQHSEALTLEATELEDTLVQCREADGTILFFSAETGQLVEKTGMDLLLETNKNQYLAAFGQEDGALVFGSTASPVQMLHTTAQAQYFLLPESFAVLEQSTGKLHYYDLSSGLCTSAITLEGLIASADGGNGIVWLLTEDNTLYRWDTSAYPSGDSAVYTATYFTRSNPDLAGLSECQEQARQIGERHGVEILVWEDALEAAPWDYRVTEEYQVPILEQQLQLLDQRLDNFPEGFFAQLPEQLTICLVRRLEGYNGLETLEAASGVQYWVENHPYIALSTLTATEGGLYHELCHVLDTRIIGHTNAYDQWEKLNPSGFRYDYDYETNATRNAGEYLRDAERCFIDTYSMSFPKEDRARVLEYAMISGNEHYFQSDVMQAKLMQICLGIREAFGLKKSPETFLWEQYLQESLAYDK